VSRFGKTHDTEELIQPGYPKVLMGARRMGKTEMIRKMAEAMNEGRISGSAASGNASSAITEADIMAMISKHGMGEPVPSTYPFSTGSISTSSAPTSKTSAEILADIKRVKATLTPTAPPVPTIPMFETDRYKPLTKGQSMPNDIIDNNPQATALSTKLNAGFKASPPPAAFQLAGPMNASIKERNGAYKTKSFLGDEAFNPTTSYVGKKGDIIVVFKASIPTQYAFMEMSLGKAVDQLKGFQVYADGLAENSVQSVIASFDEAVVATQAAEKAGLLDNPEFASW
jgi:hypothetical protein